MTIGYYELNNSVAEKPDSLFAALFRRLYPHNPDFEELYPKVVKWYAEIDYKERVRPGCPLITSEIVLREVGLDALGEPIVFGPYGRNEGLWPDISSSIGGGDCRELPQVGKGVFEALWEELEERYRDVIPPKKIEPRIPISSVEEIVGRWSDGLLDGPGGSSDQAISFLSNGKGYFEDYNYTLMYYDEFEWELIESGIITIRGLICFYQENSQIIEDPSTFHYERIPVETQVHHSGNGSSIEALHIPLNAEKRKWVGGAYGRCETSVSDINRPQF